VSRAAISEPIAVRATTHAVAVRLLVCVDLELITVSSFGG
jgi:hypothetical protein